MLPLGRRTLKDEWISKICAFILSIIAELCILITSNLAMHLAYHICQQIILGNRAVIQEWRLLPLRCYRQLVFGASALPQKHHKVLYRSVSRGSWWSAKEPLDLVDRHVERQRSLVVRQSIAPFGSHRSLTIQQSSNLPLSKPWIPVGPQPPRKLTLRHNTVLWFRGTTNTPNPSN